MHSYRVTHIYTHKLHENWGFSWKISSVNLTKPAGNGGFSHINWRSPEWETSFFVPCVYVNVISIILSEFYNMWFTRRRLFTTKERKSPLAYQITNIINKLIRKNSYEELNQIVTNCFSKYWKIIKNFQIIDISIKIQIIHKMRWDA